MIDSTPWLLTVGTRVALKHDQLLIKAGATGKIRHFLTPTIVSVEIDKELVPGAMGNLLAVNSSDLLIAPAKVYTFPERRT